MGNIAEDLVERHTTDPWTLHGTEDCHPHTCYPEAVTTGTLGACKQEVAPALCVFFLFEKKATTGSGDQSWQVVPSKATGWHAQNTGNRLSMLRGRFRGSRTQTSQTEKPSHTGREDWEMGRLQSILLLSVS